MAPYGLEAVTLSGMPLESTESEESGNGSWFSSVVLFLRDHPGSVALYSLLVALIVSVVVRFALPNEFWLALTGLLTGLGQQMASGGSLKRNGDDDAGDGG